MMPMTMFTTPKAVTTMLTNIDKINTMPRMPGMLRCTHMMELPQSSRVAMCASFHMTCVKLVQSFKRTRSSLLVSHLTRRTMSTPKANSSKTISTNAHISVFIERIRPSSNKANSRNVLMSRTSLANFSNLSSLSALRKLGKLPSVKIHWSKTLKRMTTKSKTIQPSTKTANEGLSRVRKNTRIRNSMRKTPRKALSTSTQNTSLYSVERPIVILFKIKKIPKKESNAAHFLFLAISRWLSSIMACSLGGNLKLYCSAEACLLGTLCA
mmetsp:Transcript_149321/g.479502  ORF Transcript_149321/g.479502 Transcript_149321/m.479502 type:complete len:268 (+) Transcript_149321:2026-2829(+)